MKNTLGMKDGVVSWRVRGRYVDLVMERSNTGQGLLFKGWIQGEKGRMELGALIPEGNMLRLQRCKEHFPWNR